MNIIKKFNEQVDDHITIMENDIESFKNKFIEDKWLGRQITFDRVYQKISNLTIYEISETDDYGRSIRNIGYVKAFSKGHSLLLSAIKYNNREIYLTGFYNSKKVTIEEINKRIISLERQLNKLKSVRDL
jgi:hypothetical protein